MLLNIDLSVDCKATGTSSCILHSTALGYIYGKGEVTVVVLLNIDLAITYIQYVYDALAITYIL